MLLARVLFVSNQVPISAASYGRTVSTRTELTPGSALKGEKCAALPYPIAVDEDGRQVSRGNMQRPKELLGCCA